MARKITWNVYFSKKLETFIDASGSGRIESTHINQSIQKVHIRLLQVVISKYLDRDVTLGKTLIGVNQNRNPKHFNLQEVTRMLYSINL